MTFDINDIDDHRCPNNGRIRKTHWGYLGAGKGNSGAHLAGKVSYDFDFVEVTNQLSEAVGDVSKLHSLDGKLYEARWRSPRTIMTITMSPPIVQELLHEAGFGYDFSGARIPAGRFQADEEGMRHDIVARLSNILLDRRDENIDWGHFDVNELFAAHAEALPLRPDDQVEDISLPGNGRFAMVLMGVLVIAVGAYAAVSMSDVPGDLVASLQGYLSKTQ